MLGFVEPSFVWFGLTIWPDPNNIVWFLMGDLLRLSPYWPKPKNFFGPFSPLWNRLWWLGFYVVVVFFLLECERKYCSRTLYSSLIIVKSLQLRGRRQIVEPRKYCLVRMIVFFSVCFLYFFCFSHVGNLD